MTIDALTEQRLKKAKEQAKSTNQMLFDWAKRQGLRILQDMELKRNQMTLSIHWPQIKQGWHGGFVSGVSAGFQMGFDSAGKLTEKFLQHSTALTQGMAAPEKDPTILHLRSVIGEAVGEASMCWSETPAGVFESEKAEAIVNRVLEHVTALLQPKALPTQVEAEANGQERLPNL